MAGTRTTRRLLATGIALAIAAAAVATYFALRPPAIGSAEALELIRNKNVALGHLENHDVEEALQVLESIAAKLKDEPLLVRNRAVAHVLNLGEDDEPAAEALVAEARQSLLALGQVEGQTAGWHWLSLRVALAGSELALAQSHIDALIRLEPESAAARYAQFRLDQQENPREVTPAGASALESARNLAPTNSWLLVEWLRATGRQLLADLSALPIDEAARRAALAALSAKYGRLAEQLDASRPTVLPFAHEIRLYTRHDVLATLDEAAQAARAGDSACAAAQMLALGNVLVPRTALDRIAVRRHPLEFVADRFRPEFYAIYGVAEDQPKQAIDVQFAPFAEQVPAELVEAVGELRDFAWIDFDLDGRLDIVALGVSAVQVWSRREAAWQTIAAAPVAGMQRLAVQDLDADFDETALAFPRDPSQPTFGDECHSADVDLVLVGEAGAQVFENRFVPGTKGRELVLKQSGLPQGTPVNLVECADVEGDGDLDLILAGEGGLSIWLNYGDWTFSDASARSTLPGAALPITQLLALDFDWDVDMDVLVAAPGGGGWLENLRHGQFRWQPYVQEQPELRSAQAIAPVDADGRAQWDLLTAGASGIWHLEFRGIPVVSASRPITNISDFAATNLLTWDYDNDGWEDCLAWSASNLRTFRGKTGNQFESVDLLAAAPQQIARAAVGDLDADGDQDLALLAAGRIVLLENQGGNRNHWIDVALQARQIKGQQIAPSGRVSPYGLGSLLELKAGERYQARIVRGQTTHFGLGQETAADVIRVGWLNGVPQNIIQPAADLFVCEQQILNTSCPYLYAWDGERFVFVTDLLWNAPLGLQLAEGVLAPWRDWEYLKIPGHQLAPKDGRYVLQATAELWEADYFDHVRLIAVDHPADVEIYSNEKVGPPQMAEYKIHTVRRPQSPVAARSQAGRDLLSEIASQDGVYARPFERKLLQGVTEEHDLELDLGNLGQARQVTLFLTGWVYPAATSINVGLSQGGSIAPPRPPSLKVQDSAGNWQTALPFMGFPGGKTKTIAVPLPHETLAVRASDGALRLRISTTMEFYWDHIFFTADEPPAEVRTTELKLVSADLHERGFSRVVRDESNGPERFLYDEVSLMPKWPPMLGHFTRYGDMLELLAARDDHLLVMGAGDETTLSFQVPAMPIPPGWKRDFLLYSVGWDKDANLQTVLGRSSEPLPFQSMSAYPWPPEEQLDSSAYREYLRKYQTREQSSAYHHAIERFQAESGAAPAR